MNKKQIISWLHGESDRAHDKRARQFDQELQEYLAKRNTELKVDEVSKLLFEKFQDCSDILESWFCHVSACGGIRITKGYYGSISKFLFESLKNPEVIKERLVNRELEDVRNERDVIYNTEIADLAVIKRGYANVIRIIENCETAKEAERVLKEIGMRLPEDSKEARPAVAIVLTAEEHQAVLRGSDLDESED